MHSVPHESARETHEQLTTQLLAARALDVVDGQVEAYKKRSIKGTDVPFGYRTLDDIEVTMSLSADFDPEELDGLPPDLDDHTFSINLMVETEIDCLPEEAFAAAVREESPIEGQNFRNMGRLYQLGLSFSADAIGWTERRVYSWFDEEGAPQEQTVPLDFNAPETVALGGVVDEFSVLVGGFAAEINTKQALERIEQTLELIEAIKNKQPLTDMTPYLPPTA